LTLGLHCNLLVAVALVRVGVGGCGGRRCGRAGDAMAAIAAVAGQRNAEHGQADYEQDELYCACSSTTAEDSNENIGNPIVFTRITAVPIIIGIVYYILRNDCDITRKEGEGDKPENEAEYLET